MLHIKSRAQNQWAGLRAAGVLTYSRGPFCEDLNSFAIEPSPYYDRSWHRHKLVAKQDKYSDPKLAKDTLEIVQHSNLPGESLIRGQTESKDLLQRRGGKTMCGRAGAF